MAGRHPVTSCGKGWRLYEAIFHKVSCYDLIRSAMWSPLMCIKNLERLQKSHIWAVWQATIGNWIYQADGRLIVRSREVSKAAAVSIEIILSLWNLVGDVRTEQLRCHSTGNTAWLGLKDVRKSRIYFNTTIFLNLHNLSMEPSHGESFESSVLISVLILHT